jgi:hypothetical protein
VLETGDTEEEEKEEEEEEEGDEMWLEETDEHLPHGSSKSVNSDTTSARYNKKDWKVLSSSQRARAPLAPALRTHSQQYPSPATPANTTSRTDARVSSSLPAPTRDSPPCRDNNVLSSPPKTNPLNETFEGWPVSPPLTQTIRTSGDKDAVIQVPDSQAPNKPHAELEGTYDVVYDNHSHLAHGLMQDELQEQEEKEHVHDVGLDTHSMTEQVATSPSAIKAGEPYDIDGAHNEQEPEHASETMGHEMQQPEGEVTMVDAAQDEQQTLPDMNDQHQEGDAGITIGANGSGIEQIDFPVLQEEAGKRPNLPSPVRSILMAPADSGLPNQHDQGEPTRLPSPTPPMPVWNPVNASNKEHPQNYMSNPRLLDVDDDTPMAGPKSLSQSKKSKRKVDTMDYGPPPKLKKIKRNSATPLSQPEPHTEDSTPPRKLKRLRKSEPPQPQPRSSSSDTGTPAVNWQFSPLRSERKKNRKSRSNVSLAGESTEKTKPTAPRLRSAVPFPQGVVDLPKTVVVDNPPPEKLKKDKTGIIPSIDRLPTQDRDSFREPPSIPRSSTQKRDKTLVEDSPSKKEHNRRKSDPSLTKVSSNEVSELRNPSPPKSVPKATKWPKKRYIITPVPYPNGIAPDRTPIATTPRTRALAAGKIEKNLPNSTPLSNTVRPSSLLQALKDRRAAELSEDKDPMPLQDASESAPSNNANKPTSLNIGVPLVFDEPALSPHSVYDQPLLIADPELHSPVQHDPSQELSTPNQDIPISPQILPSSSRKKPRRSQRSKKQQQQSFEDAMEIEEAQPADVQRPDRSQPEQNVQNGIEAEHAADDEPTEDIVEVVRETPESELVQGRATRAGHASGLVGAAKELASVHKVSQPPDLRNEGPFSDDETELIRQAIANYKRIHRLDIEGLVNVVQASRSYRSGGESRHERASRLDQEKILQDTAADFWIEVFQALPDRKKPSVRKAVRAKYHNNKGHGNWDEEEDQRLRGLYEEYGAQWTVIAEQMRNRDDGSCRLRWNNYLQHGEKRNTEQWNEEEETKLRQAVKDATDSSRQEIDWTTVSAAMGTRSRVQIAQKWKKLLKRDATATNATNQALPKRRKSKKPKLQDQSRSYDNAVKDTSQPQPDTIFHSVEIPKPDNTKLRTIGAELMRAGDKVDLMESVVSKGRPIRFEDIDWDNVANGLRFCRWSAADCEEGFRQLLTYAGAQASFPEALSALDVLISEVTEKDREQIYDRGEDDEHSSKKRKSNKLVTASSDEE